MRAEIRPEPTPEERAAIDAALAQVLRSEAPVRGHWWRLGVRESLTAGPAQAPRRSGRRRRPEGR